MTAKWMTAKRKPGSTQHDIELLDRTCVERCSKYNHLTPGGRPNMRLLYSTPETFEPRTSIMWLGKNPGGEPAGR